MDCDVRRTSPIGATGPVGSRGTCGPGGSNNRIANKFGDIFASSHRNASHDIRGDIPKCHRKKICCDYSSDSSIALDNLVDQSIESNYILCETSVTIIDEIIYAKENGSLPNANINQIVIMQIGDKKYGVQVMSIGSDMASWSVFIL